MSEEINGSVESCDENTEAPDTSKSELRHRYEEALAQLCLIERMNEQISLLDDMPSLCLSIVQTVLEFTVAENCSIMLNDSSSGALRLFVAKGKGDRGSHIGSDRIETTILNSGEGIAGLAARTGEIICVDDCEADNRFVELKTAAKTVRSLVSAPIVSDDVVLGVMNCSHSIRKQFKDMDKLNISLVADHAAVLLQRAIAADHTAQNFRALEKQVEDKAKSIEEYRAKQVEMRKQLYKSEKFVTLGEMLAGIAHELNNRVAPILIYSQMLQQSTDNEQDSKRLRIVEDSAKGAKAILETLLTYSHEGTNEQEAVNLNQIIQNALTLTEYKVRNQSIELIVDLSPQLPPAEVNEMQMAQVFLNIINNALHAMESEGGKLSIQSECEGANIRITIADSGPGIPEDIATRIFTPFFTTKEAGKGTGLGLSISKRYVEENCGGIRLEKSTLGGAAFVIEVPGLEIKSVAADNKAFPSATTAAATSATTAAATGARILVVDDDSTICDVIRDILGPGYQVEFASDGHVATEKIGTNPFDLLLVDYHMPGLDGKQLYEWIVGNHPAMSNRVVFSTGDIYHDSIRDFIDSTGCNCLIKPFTTKNLREIVTGALGRCARGTPAKADH
jgi:signal transduction histidine kinase